MDTQQCGVCIVELHVTVNNIKTWSVVQQWLLWRRHIAGNNTPCLGFFHSCAVHLDAIKVFYLPTDAQQFCLREY
jgi:hypothetical protein